ncbi:hypothetical protein F2P56_008663 [Juglans regia]|uniref:Protein FAR-RED IMPAIRED RESPONSE 1-like n=2 Tax=Juglans regia TaxID=51240 RepID=A0A2I4EL10_JUGRE|nr:protein FAR-RED IMPAIRED RESPONSE 1-like [Juglans regia]KAF5471899.1 hypothetical protein F2P56_008663 [Juglans regia]
MNKSFAALVQEAGVFENLLFLEKDCRNYIDKARHLRIGKGGARALREYFAKMQYRNDGFFAMMDFDDDNRLRNYNNALRKKTENENGDALENIFQELCMNSKFREVQQEIMGMLSCLPILHQKDGVIAIYHVEDEVCVVDFVKEVTHLVYFNETTCDSKCSWGLSEMSGILCTHVLAVFKINHVRNVPEKYILDQWRNDIKMRYIVMKSNYDVADARP